MSESEIAEYAVHRRDCQDYPDCASYRGEPCDCGFQEVITAYNQRHMEPEERGIEMFAGVPIAGCMDPFHNTGEEGSSAEPFLQSWVEEHGLNAILKLCEASQKDRFDLGQLREQVHNLQEKSRPVRGAWIETPSFTTSQLRRSVAPRTGRVD